VSVLYNDAAWHSVLQEAWVKVEAVLNDDGREFWGINSHPFEVFPKHYSINHRRIKPRTNVFVEHFHKTVGEEFFGPALKSTRYETVNQLQTVLDNWLDSYNYERPHLGVSQS
jgi:hypothetical protein